MGGQDANLLILTAVALVLPVLPVLLASMGYSAGQDACRLPMRSSQRLASVSEARVPVAVPVLSTRETHRS